MEKFVQPYDMLGKVYESMSWDVFAPRVFAYVQQLFERYKLTPNNILDLACGIGTFAEMMAKKGVEVVGLDYSTTMLSIAKLKETPELPLQFVQGDMRSFRLGQTFDVVTILYDSLNYCVEKADIEKTFYCVATHLNEGGYLMFDMNTPDGHRKHWNGNWKDKTENFILHRIARCNAQTKMAICEFIFCFPDGSKIYEVHHQRGYEDFELITAASKVNLNFIEVFECFTFNPPHPETSRRFYVFSKK